MSALTHVAIAAVNAALNAITGQIGSSATLKIYTDNALTGTVSVTNGSASITFSTAQTITAGTILQFASQPGVYYTLTGAITAQTSATLSSNYTGTTNASTTTGTRPGTPDVAVFGGNTVLASLPMSATPYANASAGTATANAITNATAAATGTATWFRIATSGGAGILDGSAGTASSDMVLNSTAISSGATVAVSSATLSMAQ